MKFILIQVLLSNDLQDMEFCYLAIFSTLRKSELYIKISRVIIENLKKNFFSGSSYGARFRGQLNLA